MKTVWQGTDSLLLVKMPEQLTLIERYYALKLRLFARIADKFAVSHYCIGNLTEKNLRAFGMKKPLVQFRTPIDQSLKVEKIPHDTFNILYYSPKKRTKFRDWIYGRDVFLNLQFLFKEEANIRWIIVDGDQDMREVYPYVDYMIRPNRHDGFPRMVKECVLNNIPYYWSNENPKIGVIIDLIKMVS